MRADLDGLLPAAIDEGMRWISPIGTQGRRTTRGSSSAASTCRADAPVAAVIASANRDPRRFADPDRFDIHRERRRLATFGFGRHFCSGHAFARAQERIALRRLLESRCGRSSSPASREIRGWEFRAPREPAGPPALSLSTVRRAKGDPESERPGYAALADRDAVLAALTSLIADAWQSFERPAAGRAGDRRRPARAPRACRCRRSPTTRPGCLPTPPASSTSRTRPRGRSTSATSARPGSRSGCSPRRSRRPTTSTSRSPPAPPTWSSARRSSGSPSSSAFPAPREPSPAAA